MTAGWECARCGQMHTQNPSKCRGCGHVIFTTLSEAELERRSSGVNAPEAMEISDDRVMGTAPDDWGASSPDVAVDGSVVEADDSAPQDNDDTQSSFFQRLRAMLPF